MSGTDDRETDRSARDPKSAAAIYAANKRRLQRIRAEAARTGEHEWRGLFRFLETVLRQIHANRRIMDDPVSRKHVMNIANAADLEELNFELKVLAERLNRLANESGDDASRPLTGDPDPSTGAADGRVAAGGAGHPPTAGRRHLRL